MLEGEGLCENFSLKPLICFEKGSFFAFLIFEFRFLIEGRDD